MYMYIVKGALLGVKRPRVSVRGLLFIHRLFSIGAKRPGRRGLARSRPFRSLSKGDVKANFIFYRFQRIGDVFLVGFPMIQIQVRCQEVELQDEIFVGI